MDPDLIYIDIADLLAGFVRGLTGLLPDLVGALFTVLIGGVVALALRVLLRRLIRGLDRIVPSRRFRQSLQRAQMGKPAAEILSNVVFWLILFVSLAAAAQRLGLPVVSSWLTSISSYLPSIFSASLVILAGVVGGLLLRDLVATAATSAGLAYGNALARLAQTAAVTTGVLIGVDQLGFNVAVVTNALVTFLAAVLFGAALAFGLGARATVSNILASHYLRKSYTIGHTVRVGEVTGEIVEFTPTAVVLETAEGRALVPAQLFGETVSLMPVRPE